MNDSFKITEYNETAAALAILREKYCTVFNVQTTKGMDEARKARAEIRSYRVSLEKVRKEIKAPALERSRLIDEEAKRITAELLAIEEPIDQQIKAEEQRKEEEKAAKARAEAARIASIAAKISALRNRISLVANQPATAIKAELENALALELSADEFQEFLPDAQEALAETLAALQSALENRVVYEAEQTRIQEEQAAEQARIHAEREELARLRELEAEQARIAEEARNVETARLQQERERQEAELKAQREAMEQQRAELEAQQRKLDEAEQHRLQHAEAAVVKPIIKCKAHDPLADLKQALNADEQTAQALDEAYQRGFQDGLNSAQ